MARYTCPECGAWVKDKFLFGLLHFCVPQETPLVNRFNGVIQRYQRQGEQASIEEFREMIRTGITLLERKIMAEHNS